MAQMPRVTCPECGYLVGLGVASEPGRCPSCDVPLMLTCEMRALESERARDGAERRDAEPDRGAVAGL